jgi:hypothetical protein
LLIECIALLAVGALGLAGGIGSYLRSDARTQSSLLQPGVFVSVLAIALIATAIVYAGLGLRRIRAAGAATPGAPDGQGGRRALAVYGAVVIYGLAISVLGYLAATVLFLAAEFRILGVRSWPRIALLTLVVTGVFYLLFVRYGEMVFPRGALLG